MAENRPVGQHGEGRSGQRRPDQKVVIAADGTSDGARLKGALQFATTLAKFAACATVKPAAPKAPPVPAKPLPPRPTVFRVKVKGR